MIKRMRILLILIGIVVSSRSAHAQTGNDYEYVEHDLAEIGVSFEAPDGWVVSLNAGDMGGFNVMLPDSEEVILDVVFLPKEATDSLYLFDYSNQGLAQAFGTQFYIYNDSTEPYRVALPYLTPQPDLVLTDGQEIPTLLNYVAYTEHYIIAEDGGIIWATSNYFSQSIDGESRLSAIGHILSTLRIDWDQAIPQQEVGLAQILERGGVSPDKEIPELTATSFGVANTQEDFVLEDTQWQTEPAFNSGTRESIFEHFGYFDIYLTSADASNDSEIAKLSFNAIPQDVVPGIYQVQFRYTVPSNPSRITSGNGLLIITEVEATTLSGVFYGYTGGGNSSQDFTMITAHLDNITIPRTTDCQIFHNTLDPAVEITANFVDDFEMIFKFEDSILAENLGMENANLAWIVEREHHDFSVSYFTSEGEVSIYQGSTQIYLFPDEDFASVLGFSLAFDERDIAKFGQPYIQLNILLDGQRPYDVHFDGTVDLTATDTTVSGVIDGTIYFQLSEDIELKLASISGSFTDLPLPAPSCAEMSK